MKGITPIISIIILLLITIALAATAYSYMSGFLFGQVSSSFSVPNGGAFCSGAGEITVMVRNDALEGNITNDFFAILQINGNDVTPVANIEIPAHKAGTIIKDNNGGSGWPTGYNKVTIGTASNIVHTDVYCP